MCRLCCVRYHCKEIEYITWNYKYRRAKRYRNTTTRTVQIKNVKESEEIPFFKNQKRHTHTHEQTHKVTARWRKWSENDSKLRKSSINKFSCEITTTKRDEINEWNLLKACLHIHICRISSDEVYFFPIFNFCWLLLLLLFYINNKWFNGSTLLNENGKKEKELTSRIG